MALIVKHNEMEARAEHMISDLGAERYIETLRRGVTQHVVCSETAILRWNVEYAGDPPPPKVRCESLSAHVTLG